MPTRDFSKYTLYRWRYVIGYAIVGLALAALLVFAGLYLPGGLSDSEKASVVRSASLSLSHPQTLAVPHLPYHAFQAAIFSLFGITIFTIKLPSLILALLSAIGLILLLRRWFQSNIAVLASLIAITTGQFLYIAQLGAPSVMYIFWPVALLLLGTQITRVKRFRFFWKIMFAITAGLSLYTPLGAYPLIAITLAVAFHPHLRAVIRRLSRFRLAVVAIVFLLVSAPLVWLISLSPQLGLTLLGVPSAWPPDFGENAVSLLRQYFLFWKPSTTVDMTPFFGFGSALLILLGLYRLVRTRETTRSYLIIFWIVCLIPALLFNPTFTSVTFVPSVMMLAAGLTSLISYWYRLFPRNPYARITGLIPIIILVGALITTGLMRYIYGYHYNPSVVPLFSQDLRLLPKGTIQLVVSDNERAFYEAIARYHTNVTVKTEPTSDTFIVTREARRDFEGYTIERIIVSDGSRDADRFYVMQRTK